MKDYLQESPEYADQAGWVGPCMNLLPIESEPSQD